MFSVSNLSVQFGGDYLFDNISFNISNSDKIGLIGKNGSGKSTLLKILAREIKPENGNLNQPNEYIISYLPQEGSYTYHLSLKKEAETALVELQSLEDTINKLNEEVATRQDYESDYYSQILHELSDANDRFVILGGNEKEAKVIKILKGLGFMDADMDKNMNEFSGGWQMRCELAKILLASPDCILLDEPTNHLDIESIIWLENFLKNYKGSTIVVSHDKKFLDNMTNRTIEIAFGKIYDKPLSFSKFIDYRKEQRRIQSAAKKNQDKKIAQTERFIERFKAKATLTSRAQSKEKMLNKLERIEVDEEDKNSIRFNFPSAPSSGRLVNEIKNLSKSYGDNLVLSNIDFVVEKGDRIAFVGKNGEGKSTLSKILAGLLDYDGEMEEGHNVILGYFAQHQAKMLDENQTVFEVIDNAAKGDMRTRVRSLLGTFLFSGDTVYKKIKVLSGGEKSRLSLAKLLLEPVNFLIMDEPTNHLDMQSKEVLKEALKNFDGALIIVSHDREFLEGLTNKTLYFKDKKIKEYPGYVSEFLEELKLNDIDDVEKKNQNKSNSSSNNDNKKKAESKGALNYNQLKEAKREKEKVKREVAKIESNIENIETEISEIELMFTDIKISSDAKKMTELNTKHQQLNKQLEEAMQKWEEAQSKLEELHAIS